MKPHDASPKYNIIIFVIDPIILLPRAPFDYKPFIDGQENWRGPHFDRIGHRHDFWFVDR